MILCMSEGVHIVVHLPYRARFGVQESVVWCYVPSWSVGVQGSFECDKSPAYS